MTERQPKPADFANRSRYYNALIIWLEWRHPDDQTGRRKEWRRIKKENRMPVKREVRAAEESDIQRLARFEMEQMMERAGVGPRVSATKTARLRELIALSREMTKDEQAEFDQFVRERQKARHRSRHFAEVVNKRQRKHPEETRGESTLAVILKSGRKRDVREAKRTEAENAAYAEKQDAQREAVTAGRVGAGAPSAPNAPATTEPPEAAPKRRRNRISVEFIPLDPHN